jgi:sec-independent protein translocase protein TatA
MMGDVAKGLKSFKQGMSDDDDDARKRYDEKRRNEPPRSIGRQDDPIDVTPRSADPTSPPPRDDETR